MIDRHGVFFCLKIFFLKICFLKGNLLFNPLMPRGHILSLPPEKGCKESARGESCFPPLNPLQGRCGGSSKLAREVCRLTERHPPAQIAGIPLGNRSFLQIKKKEGNENRSFLEKAGTWQTKTLRSFFSTRGGFQFRFTSWPGFA